MNISFEQQNKYTAAADKLLNQLQYNTTEANEQSVGFYLKKEHLERVRMEEREKERDQEHIHRVKQEEQAERHRQKQQKELHKNAKRLKK